MYFRRTPFVDQKLEYAKMLLNTQRKVFPNGIPSSGSPADSLSSISSAESNALTDGTPPSAGTSEPKTPYRNEHEMMNQGIHFWRRAEELAEISGNNGDYRSSSEKPRP